MKMRTTSIIKQESDKALNKYQNHFKKCIKCKNINNEGETCSQAEFLYKDYETLIIELSEAELTFNQEIEERKIKH